MKPLQSLALFVILLAGCEQQVVVDKPQVQTTQLEDKQPPQPAPQKSIFTEPAETDPATAVTFNDLNLNLEGDVAFKPEQLTNRAKELEGKRIRIGGVMHGNVEKPKENTKFVLLRNKGMHHGPGLPADQLILVEMQPPETIDLTTDTVQVTGILRIKPETGADGNTWSLYILEEATAKKLP